MGDTGSEQRRDRDHDDRVRNAVERALTAVPFYAKSNLGTGLDHNLPLDRALRRLPLLTRERIRPTLPKVWFPEGRDAKSELASGAISVVESGASEARVRLLFDAAWWRAQERRALAIHPRAAAVLGTEPVRDAVLWVPERGTGSCGAGDPTYEDRLSGARLHLNSRQDPTFWTASVMTRMLDELGRHETAALLADPFYLDVLAEHAASVGRRLDVRGFVATTRARATLAQRARLAKVFAPEHTVDAFGARAVGTLFVSGDDGKLHHAPGSTHVELLRAKVQTPGASDVALVVVTTLDREIQPLVRYVLGDLVQIAPGEGRFTSVPPLASVEGSIDDALVRPDGAVVTPGAIDRAIGEGHRGYQVVQAATDAVEVEVLGADPKAIEAALSPLLSGMGIAVRRSTTIGVEPNGKYRTTRRKQPLALADLFDGHEGGAR